jgi:FAD/FMN-containing dehydrogenase
MPPKTPEKMATPPPPLDGELRFDEVTRKGRADDFGHIVHHMPEGVLLPGSADDVAKTIQWAAPRGGRFAPQGRRHSTFGRSQVPSGIVADMSTLRSIGPVDGGQVVVEAGATWGDVLRATLAQGKTAGGTLYPVSALPMSKGEWRDHFGSAFGQLDAAKQQYDPDEILTPGYEIF